MSAARPWPLLAGLFACASLTACHGGDPGDDGDRPGADASPGDEGADAGPREVIEPPESAVTTAVVTTADELIAALASATPGSVVHVADDAVLDLTGHENIVIPAQVTLASGGGVGGAGGALLYTDQLDTFPLFSAGGHGVRVTGLRLRGPDPDIGATPYGEPLSRGIQASRQNNLTVDHCELSGWSHAAIVLEYSERAYVHHNSIHHNRRTGLGYGVVLVRRASALIERNRFDENRHDIAGTGHPAVSYTARYNLTGPNRSGHAFDMHGENEADGDGSPYAGGLLRIHHNSFRGTDQAIVIRGRPKDGGYIHDNCFGQSASAGTAIIQRFFSGNLFIDDNVYSAAPTCHEGPSPTRAVRSDVSGDGLADLVTLVNGSAHSYLGSPSFGLIPAPPAFRGTMKTALFSGEGHVVIDVADVDGDTRADLVTAHDSGTVYVYPGRADGSFGGAVESFAGTYRLETGDGSGFEPIAVADVDGDGFGDLVSNRGGTATVHPGRADGTFGSAAESFRGTLNPATFDGKGHFPIDVADVTGDGRADLATVTDAGDAWLYPGKADGSFGSGVASFSGTFHPAYLDGQGFEPVGLGDVDGDGRADLISAHTAGTTYVYLGTQSGQFGTRVDSFAGTMPTSLFGGRGFEVVGALDVSGDGRTDLITVHPDGGLYIYPGTPAGAFDSSVVTLDGEFRTTRGDRVGWEVVSERPLLRRRGCAADGCF